jgi:hypothetical protein
VLFDALSQFALLHHGLELAEVDFTIAVLVNFFDILLELVSWNRVL